MALKLQSYDFLIITMAFIYPKGTKEEDKSKTNPEYVKFSGFVQDDDGYYTVCHIFDKFEEYGKTKDQLSSLTLSRACISGKGLLKLDNNFNYSLQLQNYEFGKYYWDFELGTQKFED